MPTYVYRNGRLIDKRRAKPSFSADSAAYVISDIMAETQHMATGRFHTSKSEFRKDTKDSNCIEIGNETKALLAPRKPVMMDRAKRRDDIRRTIYELRNGRG